MLLSGAGGLELDSVVRFRLDLGGGAGEIEGLARVVRSDQEGRRALVFEQISQRERQRLIHFVFERQRQALAKVGRVVRHRNRRAG
jgi:c-di-GMP-binding flagellar brake protein YcgR